MNIGGFLKQSFIDYPGKIASVIFTKGCNFRCFYCHNPELVLPDLMKQNSTLEVDYIMEYLIKNKDLLDAVVISGGEPTIQNDLPKFIAEIKELSLLVKLDTNGTNPKMLAKLIRDKLVDYIAMDIKSRLTLQKYQEIVGEEFSLTQMDRVRESIHLIQNSDIEYEFRTTLVSPDHTVQDVLEISKHIKGNYYIQTLRKDKTLSDVTNKSSILELEINDKITKHHQELNIRFRN